nr:hypothetical protein CFP56_67279 [Quercus suber]
MSGHGRGALAMKVWLCDGEERRESFKPAIDSPRTYTTSELQAFQIIYGTLGFCKSSNSSHRLHFCRFSSASDRGGKAFRHQNRCRNSWFHDLHCHTLILIRKLRECNSSSGSSASEGGGVINSQVSIQLPTLNTDDGSVIASAA